MKSWFSKRSMCPTGCGCFCEGTIGSDDGMDDVKAALLSEDLSDDEDDAGDELDLYQKYFSNRNQDIL